MQEAKARIAPARLPVGARFLEQCPGADHVRLHELGRPGDRAVDVALGGEVHDGARAMRGEQVPDPLALADVALHETVPRVVAHRVQIAGVAGVGQLVEVDDRLARRLDGRDDEIRADEPGPAGDEEHGADYPELPRAR